VHEHADKSDVLYIEPIVMQSQPIAINVRNRFEPALSLEPWIAWLFSCLHSSEECLKGFIQPAQSLLEGGIVAPGCIAVEGPDLLQLVGLVVIADADAALSPGFPSFLKSVVVDLTVNIQDTAEILALLMIGVEAIFVAKKHQPIIAQMFLFGNENLVEFSAFPSPLKEGVPCGIFMARRADSTRIQRNSLRPRLVNVL